MIWGERAVAMSKSGDPATDIRNALAFLLPDLGSAGIENALRESGLSASQVSVSPKVPLLSLVPSEEMRMLQIPPPPLKEEPGIRKFAWTAADLKRLKPGCMIAYHFKDVRWAGYFMCAQDELDEGVKRLTIENVQGALVQRTTDSLPRDVIFLRALTHPGNIWMCDLDCCDPASLRDQTMVNAAVQAMEELTFTYFDKMRELRKRLRAEGLDLEPLAERAGSAKNADDRRYWEMFREA